MELTESELTESDLQVLAENPLEVSKDALQGAVSTIGSFFRGVRRPRRASQHNGVDFPLCTKAIWPQSISLLPSAYLIG